MEQAEWLEQDGLAGVETVPVFPSSGVLGRRRDDLPNSVLRAGPQVLAASRLVRNAARALRRLGVDVVHTNTLKAHVLGGAAARLARLPLIWHMRDILGPGSARNWLLRVGRATRPHVLAISHAVAQQFSDTPFEARVIHNGVPLDWLSPGPPSPELREQVGLSEDDDVVCVVSRLTPWKGHRTLLEAVSEALQRAPQIKLMVVGEVTMWEESYGQELREYAEELGIQDRVLWLGFRSDIPELLRLCDVFVLPSEDEPFGRVIVEAMAVGKAVVASRSGGVPEIVVDGETGIMVAPREAGELAQALVRLIEDPELAASMGERGLQRARQEFDSTRVAAMVQDFYDAVL